MTGTSDLAGHRVWVVTCTCGFLRSCAEPSEATSAAVVHQLGHRVRGEHAVADRARLGEARMGSWTTATAW